MMRLVGGVRRSHTFGSPQPPRHGPPVSHSGEHLVLDLRTRKDHSSPKQRIHRLARSSRHIVEHQLTSMPGLPSLVQVSDHRKLACVFALEIVHMPLVMRAWWVDSVHEFPPSDSCETGLVQVGSQRLHLSEKVALGRKLRCIGPPTDEVGSNLRMHFLLTRSPYSRGTQCVFCLQLGNSVPKGTEDLVWEKAVNHGSVSLQYLLNNALNAPRCRIHGKKFESATIVHSRHNCTGERPFFNQIFYDTSRHEKAPAFAEASAVWTRLELATPCVTGRYSNQLNYQTSLPGRSPSEPSSNGWSAKIMPSALSAQGAIRVWVKKVSSSW